MMRKTILLLALAVLIFSGCILKKPVNMGCCLVNESADNPICENLTGAGDNVAIMENYGCSIADGICNISVKVTSGDFSNTSDKSVPICANKASPCMASDCVAQLCGNLHYNPTPSASQRDSQNFQAEARDTGRVSAVSSAQEKAPVGMYGMVCKMIPTGDLMSNFLKNSKGSFINTFRLGVGGSFDEFDHYRYLNPISDSYCNANPFAGTKERYMNYLMTPEEFEKKMDGRSIDPTKNLTSESFCLKNDVSPFVGRAYYGAPKPDYRYRPVTNTGYTRSYSKIDSNASMLDKKFYINFLFLLYQKELKEGLESYTGIPVPAPFECQSGLDCGSAYCSFQDYNRMLCKNKETGTWVRCGCEMEARRCKGQMTNITFVDDTPPADANGIYNHLSAYMDGKTFYNIEHLLIGTKIGGFNPSCTVSTDSKVDGIDYLYPGFLAGGRIFDLIQSGQINVSEEDNKTLYECAAMESEGYPPNEDCQKKVDDILKNLPKGIADEEVGGSYAGKFPNDIVFFGEAKDIWVKTNSPYNNNLVVVGEDEGGQKTSAIGYTILSEARFKQTDFYTGCNPSYEIVEANFTINITDFYGQKLYVDPNEPYVDWEYSKDDIRTALGDGSFFVPPAPIPPTIGFQREEEAVCHWNGDDHGKFRYVPYYIFIKDTGICVMDADKMVPTTKAFGWCEPCSYSTLAKQNVKTVANYTTYFETQFYGYGTTKAYRDPRCTGSSYYGTVTCYGTDDPSHPNGRDYAQYDFNGDPNSIYLQKRQSQYLKESVMPVIDISDPSNWNESIRGVTVYQPTTATGFYGQTITIPAKPPITGLLLKHTVIDRGPSILIAGKIPKLENITYQDENNVTQNKTVMSVDPVSLKMHLDSARITCPSCIIALKVSSGAPLSLNNSNRTAMDLSALDLINSTNAPGLLENIDMIAFEFYPNELSREDASLCAISYDERNERVVLALENKTREIMMKTKLPTIASDFWMLSEDCWDQSAVQTFMSYVLMKQKRLAKSGLTGLIYTNVSTLESGAFYTDQFCAIEKGDRNIVADEPMTLYSKLYTMPQEQVKCESCTDFDITLGRCNKTCADGVECTMDESAAILARKQLKLPADTPSDKLPMKCPQTAMPEPCVPCSERGGTLDCRFFMNNGTYLNATYDVSDLGILQPDIIASIPSPYACCLTEEGGNFTFSKQTQASKISAPIMFSSTGDPRQDCGVSDVTALDKPVCAVPIPVKNYKVECTFKLPPRITRIVPGLYIRDIQEIPHVVEP